jgi:hypothetical protein
VPAEISNNAEAVAAIAETLGQLSQTWADIGQRLQSAAAAAGECWGTDDTGQSFAAAYLPAHQQLIAGLVGNGQVGDGAAGNAAAAASNLIDTNEASQQTAATLDF